MRHLACLLAYVGACLVACLGALGAAPARAEHWIATSSTASAITGNVTFSPGEIRFGNGSSLKLSAPETIHGFRSISSTVDAQLYRVLTPADPALLHNNRLCGAANQPKPAQAIVVWLQPAMPGGGLPQRGLAVYSTPSRPASDRDPGLCGTFFYDQRP